jgi:LuxR family transcriptional regulator, maltose regulon positive regulatory protein
MARKRVALPAKLTLPRLYAPVARARLYEKLDAARAHPVIWITAPPGAGKTTLVAAYLQSRECPLLWYQMDAGDADPAAFCYFLSLARNSTSARAALPTLSAGHLRNLPGFARAYFRSWYAGVETPFALVLDNYHEVSGAGPMQVLITEGLREIPRDVTVFILSRTDPPKEFAPLVASQALTTIGFDALKVTSQEAAEFVRSAGHTLDPDVVGRIHERTAGWAAGLVLLAEYARHAGFDTQRASQESMEGLFHYFASQVLATLSPGTQEFLLASAVLPRLTAATAEALTGHAEAAEILQTIFRRRLFIDRSNGSAATYRYHGLFREFLLDRLRQASGDARVLELQARAAAIMEAEKAGDEAIELYLAAGEFAAAARLILSEARTLQRQGRRFALAQWIARLPESMRSQSGWLLFWFALGHPDLVAAREILRRGHALLVQQQDLVGRLLSSAWFLPSYFAVQRGDVRPMDPWLEEIERLLPASAGRIPPEVEYEVLIAVVPAMMARRPAAGFLVKCAERLLELLEQAPAHFDLLAGGTAATIYLRWAGDLARAERLARRVEPLLERPCDVLVKAWWLLHRCALRATLCAELGPVAEEKLDRAAALLSAEGMSMLAPTVDVARLELLVGRGEIEEALLLARRLDQALHPRPGYERVNFHAQYAYLALRRGEPLTALQQAQTGLVAAEASGLVSLHAFILLASALAHSELREFDRALACLAQARDGMAGPCFRFNAGLIEAYCALLSGNDNRVTALLAEALAIGRQAEFLNTWFWLPHMMSRLCAYALRNGMEEGYVRDLIRQRDLQPADPDMERWPWPVRIYALGRWSVVIDGEPLRSRGKAQRKPLDLLKAILAEGGRGVDRGKLLSSLWPDLDGDAANNALDLALHRLRKLLQRDDAVKAEEGKLYLNARLVWTDTWAFERLSTQIEQFTRDAGETPPHAALSGRLLRLYLGHFLMAEDEPWIAPARERLRSKFVRCVRDLAEHLNRLGSYEAATTLFQRAIELDPLAEEFHLGLMRSLKQQGRIAEALEAYRRCRDLLGRALGIAPSASTQALHDSLKSS